jgi:hypothetical protein
MMTCRFEKDSRRCFCHATREILEEIYHALAGPHSKTLQRFNASTVHKDSAHETHEGHEKEKPIPKLSRLLVCFVGKKLITERGAARKMAA